jgi:hypothetical protein
VEYNVPLGVIEKTMMTLSSSAITIPCRPWRNHPGRPEIPATADDV